jgi:hypothetical protein
MLPKLDFSIRWSARAAHALILDVYRSLLPLLVLFVASVRADNALPSVQGQPTGAPPQQILVAIPGTNADATYSQR